MFMLFNQREIYLNPKSIYKIEVNYPEIGLNKITFENKDFCILENFSFIYFKKFYNSNYAPFALSTYLDISKGENKTDKNYFREFQSFISTKRNEEKPETTLQQVIF